MSSANNQAARQPALASDNVIKRPEPTRKNHRERVTGSCRSIPMYRTVSIILETSVGQVRVCVFPAFWLGCSRGFRRHAVCLRNDIRLQADMRPARATTFCKEQRPWPCRAGVFPCKGTPLCGQATCRLNSPLNHQGAGKMCNRTCSALTQTMKVFIDNTFNIIISLLKLISGQLRFLG